MMKTQIWNPNIMSFPPEIGAHHNKCPNSSAVPLFSSESNYLWRSDCCSISFSVGVRQNSSIKTLHLDNSLMLIIHRRTINSSSNIKHIATSAATTTTSKMKTKTKEREKYGIITFTRRVVTSHWVFGGVRHEVRCCNRFRVCGFVRSSEWAGERKGDRAEKKTERADAKISRWIIHM